MDLKNKELKKLAATLGFLSLKVQGFHFIVKGSNFRNAHNQLRKFYKTLNESYDTFNERLVQLGETPILGIKDIQDNKIVSIPESSGNTEIEKIYLEIIRDFDTLNEYFDKLINLCINAKDYVSEDLIRDEKQWLEKRIWILKSSID